MTIENLDEKTKWVVYWAKHVVEDAGALPSWDPQDAPINHLVSAILDLDRDWRPGLRKKP